MNKITAPKRKILFLGETYRADAITWIKGLVEFGNFEIISWELKSPSHSFFYRFARVLEYLTAFYQIKKMIKTQNPDMIIAERTTSYGFLATIMGIKPVAIAQQGRTDLWPEKSVFYPIKKLIQRYAFKNATLIHAWGPMMTVWMKKVNVSMQKVMVLPKGIDLRLFEFNLAAENTKISAIVTRSLQAEYGHETILKAFTILHQQNIDFELRIVGSGKCMPILQQLASKLNIASKVIFMGKINNNELPKLLQTASLYISMPTTEGVSASLFEAMASGCYPVVSNLLGNQSWIQHKKNGLLVAVNDSEMLANAIVWASKNANIVRQSVLDNRLFIEENVNYETNMKLIATKYHQLISESKK